MEDPGQSLPAPADHDMSPAPPSTRRAIVAGLVAAALGGVVWALIVILSDYEVGYVAWAVGGLVGFAMARTTDARGRHLATTAAILAAGGLVLGKGLSVVYGVKPALATQIQTDSLWMAEAAYRDLEVQGLVPEEITSALDDLEATDTLPDTLFVQMVAAGMAHAASLSESERRDVAMSHAGLLLRSAPMVDLVSSQFSPWDLLWFALALTTAWKLMMPSTGITQPADEETP